MSTRALLLSLWLVPLARITSYNVCYTKLLRDPLWVFEGYPLPELPWLVLVARAMAHARIDQAPATPDHLEGAAVVAEEYNNTTRAARKLAAWLRQRGFHAEAHGGPWAGPVNLLPAAIACGFGELGKHGSLINRELRNNFV